MQKYRKKNEKTHPKNKKKKKKGGGGEELNNRGRWGKKSLTVAGNRSKNIRSSSNLVRVLKKRAKIPL